MKGNESIQPVFLQSALYTKPFVQSLTYSVQDSVVFIAGLEQREAYFCDEDEAKEKFLINLEQRIKETLIKIEKLLYKRGLLVDADEDSKAVCSSSTADEVAIVDTGNELLNQRLTKLVSKKIADKEKAVTPTLDELSEIMREVRKEQGDSSNIPDPETNGAEFFDLLENVALAVARAHKHYVTEQFVGELDKYVPEPDRPLCATLPQLTKEWEELFSTKITSSKVPDEVFHMEVRAAGLMEQKNPELEACDEAIDTTLDIDEGDDEEEDEEEEEDEGEGEDVEGGDGNTDVDDLCEASSHSSLRCPTPEDIHPESLDDDLSKTLQHLPDADLTEQKPLPDTIPEKEKNCVEKSSASVDQISQGATGLDSKAKEERLKEWLEGVIKREVAVETLSDHEDDEADESKKKPMGEGEGDFKATSTVNKDEQSSAADDSDIECLGVFVTKSAKSSAGSSLPVNDERNPSKRPRLDKDRSVERTSKEEDSIDVICIDD